MGQDLPEDTPSKIRARSAIEAAKLRRSQVCEKEETGARDPRHVLEFCLLIY